MSYIPKIVGPDEKLVGIARLHWIYLVQGLIGFIFCTLVGYGMTMVIGQSLVLVGTSAFANAAASLAHNLMLFAMLAGFMIFSCYLAKVLGTEIGLTTRRVIHKEGLVFIRVHEVDIEEIRGTSMNLGYFGGILGYAALQFDCRFVGDVRTPAIEKPERFVRAMHKMRTEHVDSLTAAPLAAADKPAPENPTKPEQPPAPERPVAPVPPPSGPDIPQTPPEYPAAPPPQVPNPPQAPPPIDPQQPPLKAAVDSALVAQIVDQVMPMMVEKITDELAAKGIVPADKPTEEELLSSFDEASRKTTKLQVVH